MLSFKHYNLDYIMITIKSENIRTTQYKHSANAIIDITIIVRNQLFLNNHDWPV